MGLNVWPAPEDSGVVGPTGAAGTNGTPGKSVLQGSAVPAGSLGSDGDVYLQKTESTFLGVTSATVAVYTKAAGAWTKVGADMRGAAWYLNSGSTSSVDTKPGDMLLNTASGAIYQRNATGWGSSLGSLKGAPGSKVYVFANAAESTTVTAADGDMAVRTDTGNVYTYAAGKGWVVKGNITGAAGSDGKDGKDGTVGPQGPKGDPGSVDTVNGKAGPAVVLSAADVEALPITGGTVSGATDFKPSSGNALTAFGSTVPGTYFRVTAEGHPYSNSLRSTFYNVGVGDTTTPFGGGVRVLGMQNATTVPTSNPANGVIAYAEGGVMKVRQTDGKTVQVGAPSGAKNSWTPDALGFQAWSHDPATIPNTFDWKAYIDSNGATQRGALKAATIGRTYFAGINITEPTTVTKVVVFARGWGGSTLIPAARFFAGIYNQAGSRVAWTGSTALSNVGPAGQETGTPAAVKNGHSGAVPFSLTASVTLQPGRYWATFLMSAGAATDFYYHFVENWAVSNPANFHLLSPAFMRAGYLNSQTTLAATITPANMLTDHDPIVMALA
ncbi:hypothetical protein [Streptomyces sp. NPDC056796]|uniref:hypothetical protein n=1 Tax=Streptomyces sp. NPDC056796 TaxID=3345947 RepID=UPI0036CB39BC